MNLKQTQEKDIKRKHTNITSNECTDRCDLYNKTFENKKDLKTHIPLIQTCKLYMCRM